jgi:hypothetical protein
VCSAATTNLKTLWPPNHQLVPVTISGVTDPNGDAVTINVTGVTQDEPTNGLGDGDTGPADAVITANSAIVRLRAERSGTGNGRVYVVSFTATDPSGASCSGALRVTVQHDQKPGNVAIDRTILQLRSLKLSDDGSEGGPLRRAPSTPEARATQRLSESSTHGRPS